MTRRAANPREAGVRIVRALREAGHVAYFAGGCVRDELLGMNPADYDVATTATPEQVRPLFPGSVNEVGASFGVMLVRERGVVVEVATFRREGAYSDNRRPDEVVYAGPEDDSRRRDFTINAMFRDPLETGADPMGEIIDFQGGREDLESGVVRAVGDPSARLAEDHLRALRAVRFAARLGFRIDPGTARGVREDASELAGVSPERVGDELRRMLSVPTRAEAGRLLHELGLDGPALGEDPLPGAAETVSRWLGGLTPGAGFSTALASMEMARAAVRAAESDGTAFGETAVAAAERATALRRALCLSNDELASYKGRLYLASEVAGAWSGWPVAQKKRAAASEWWGGAIDLVHAGGLENAAEIVRERGRLERDGVGISPEPLVNGRDLISMDVPSGPEFAICLGRAYDAQLEGEVRTKPEALEFIKRMREEGTG